MSGDTVRTAVITVAAFAVVLLAALSLREPASPPPHSEAPSPAPAGEPPPAIPPPTDLRSTPTAESVPTAPARDPRKAGSPLAGELHSPGFDARHDVATLRAMLRQYLRILHGRQGPPIGNDSDLARVLTGHNPMKLVVLPPEHPALTPDGRLRDRWGTPYFIHPRGNLAFEIRSAGPDRKLFTADDLIENPGGGRTAAGGLSDEPAVP